MKKVKIVKSKICNYKFITCKWELKTKNLNCENNKKKKKLQDLKSELRDKKSKYWAKNTIKMNC